jgi:hypothetical protein
MNFPAQLLTAGLAAALTAGVAWLGDHRRARRRDPDAVGFMPWTPIFLLATVLACVLLGLAARSWFAP